MGGEGRNLFDETVNGTSIGGDIGGISIGPFEEPEQIVGEHVLLLLAPSLSSLRCFDGLLPRKSCQLRCISSSVASRASSTGGGNGGSGIGDNCGSGGESGDANLHLVGDASQELSALSPDVIILDVSM
ncbi:hypothetical protein LR48_Vigan06g052100 [Vigna angularis]|uniref:Uncharacterized protein n=1 Tax=Phaseolus angularis TaxID=3914 RepID=A0A0L9UQP7_PHAAN|nr:hypothetical protein LR48_Vigan06g052100 [Vigna angularis]